MSDQPWYKRYPSDIIAGMMGLTAEEKGVYSTLLDMMYDQRRPIKDDPSQLARICGCSTRRFRVIRDRLLEQPRKLTRRGACLSNAKFEREVGWKNAGKNSEIPVEKSEIKSPKNLGKTAEKTGIKVPDTMKSNTYPKSDENSEAGLAHAHAGARPQKLEAHKEAVSSSGPPPADTIPQKLALICKVIGVSFEGEAHRRPEMALWGVQLARMESEGVGFQHLLAAAKEMADKGRRLNDIRNLTYFKQRGTELRDQATLGAAVTAAGGHAPAPAPVTRAQWVEGFAMLCKLGIWLSSELGPAPFDSGCLAPLDVFEAGRKQWERQGDHPMKGYKAPHDPNHIEWREGLCSFPAARPFHAKIAA